MKPSITILLAATPAIVLVSAALAGPPEGLPAAATAHRSSLQRIGEEQRETTAEGRVRSQETVRVAIDGLGTRDLQGVIDDEPASLGGRQKATITDAGQTAVFSYDPGTNAITIESGGGSAIIVQNPDHSYSVDGDAAADGKAAVALLGGKEAWQSASPHAVMLAYTYAQRPNQGTKLDPTMYSESTEEAPAPYAYAAPPAVCGLFDDFCEAAACAKTGGCEE